MVVDEAGEALALCIGVEFNAAVAFLFLFSVNDLVRACITAVGFRDRGPLNTGARSGLPMATGFPVALLVTPIGPPVRCCPTSFAASKASRGSNRAPIRRPKTLADMWG
jgi:hypothetical protein